MDWWIVKELRAMVLTDLRDFVPHDYFESETEEFKLNDGIKNSNYFSREIRWGYLAGKLGKRLFFESTTTLTARQVSASGVLMNLGMLAAAEAVQGVATHLSEDAKIKDVSDGNSGAVAKQLKHEGVPTLLDNVTGALEQYLRYLTPHEAKPFLPLLRTVTESIDDKTDNEHHANIQTKRSSPSQYLSQYITIQNAQSIQIGDNNTQNIINSIQVLKNHIESSTVSAEEKEEAKSLLSKFLSHPLVTSILGAAAGTIMRGTS
jgi:hypothetical protein